jgi:predicted DNA-binding transcriptional regulator AlpA
MTAVIGYIQPPCAIGGAWNMDSSNMSVNKIIIIGNIGRGPGFDSGFEPMVPKKALPKFQDYATSISNDMPEAGGGGASAEGATTDSTSASSDDDDGGDGDGDPDPERRKRNPSPSSSGKHRNVTATADGLLWSLPTLKNAIGLSRSNIYQQIQAGKFPAPLKIGRSSRWLASEIHAWVNTQACARSPKTAG